MQEGGGRMDILSFFTFSPLVGKSYIFPLSALHKIKQYRESEGFCNLTTSPLC